jgi:signal transduction histidine kinase
MARILMVDDDQATCRLVARYLKRAGHQVVGRHDGQAGLDYALKHSLDLVLLDVMMPGLDGLAVCDALRAAESTRDLPIIVLSGRGDVQDRVAGLNRGAIDYLVKPFAPDELVARVQAALRTKELQGDLYRANRRLQHLEQRRQEFVSMLAHDIRGLLSAVSAAIEVVRLNIEDLPPRDVNRFLEIAERNTTELTELTTNLLDCYRLDEGQLRPRQQAVDLVDAARDVVERLEAQAKRSEVEVAVIGEPIGAVLGDPELLRRMLLNLVSNAIKFTPSGGRVTVELDAQLAPPSGRSGLVVAVCDTGPGIAVEDQARLFERFSSLARPDSQLPVGSGLGLSFCHQVIELHGGEIWVESTPGEGSTFAFVLLRAGEGPADAVDAAPARKPVGAPSDPLADWTSERNLIASTSPRTIWSGGSSVHPCRRSPGLRTHGCMPVVPTEAARDPPTALGEVVHLLSRHAVLIGPPVATGHECDEAGWR